MKTYEQLLSEVDAADKNSATLLSEVKALLNNLRSDSTSEADAEKATVNTKLKHRHHVLSNAVNEERKRHCKRKSVCGSDFTGCIQQDLINLFTKAIHAAFPVIAEGTVATVVPSSRAHFGDFQCNSAMSLVKPLKQVGVNLPPIEVAKQINDNLPTSDMIEKVELVKPGYLNIWLSQAFCEKEIMSLLLDGVKPPKVTPLPRVLVDFSSPNIAKEMHVGHLRSTIIGDSIARLLEFVGYEVLRINHVGDWGTQFGMLIAHLQDQFPNYLKESPPISDLQTFYKQSKVRFDEDPEFKKRAYECVVKLQNFDEDHLKAWNLICAVSRKEFQKIYDKLDIKIVERGESFYQKQMVELVRELERRGLLEEDEGRKILFACEGEIPMTIVKSDGGFTYDTSDLAGIKYRIEEDKAEWIIVVTDAGQAVHFKLLFACAEKLGILDRSRVRVDHVTFGVVLGEDRKKFKTRSGETIRLNDLLEEGVRRAADRLKEKEREKVLSAEELRRAELAVAFGCIKYADLSHNRLNDYVFSFDKMLEDKGNTAAYLLYALTRIRSIARNAGFTQQQITALASSHRVDLSHPTELKLAKLLLRFKDVILIILQDLLIHHLCEFLYEVACGFSEFYDNCYCVEKNQSGEIVKIHESRILLCEATACVMETCFSILGIKTLSRM